MNFEQLADACFPDIFVGPIINPESEEKPLSSIIPALQEQVFPCLRLFGFNPVIFKTRTTKTNLKKVFGDMFPVGQLHLELKVTTRTAPIYCGTCLEVSTEKTLEEILQDCQG